MSRFILALDQGTTSSRAILFDKQGNTCFLSQKPFKQIYPQAGWVEHRPEDIWQSQSEAICEVLQNSAARLEDIAAVAIANQRETAVIWDRQSGKPVYNAIVWQCRRTASTCLALKESDFADYVIQATGLPIDAYFSSTKIKWILDHVKGAKTRAERGELAFGTVDSWLLWKLTEGKTHATDYSNASRTMLYNIHSLSWDKKILEELGIAESLLPQVLPSSGYFGTVSAKISGMEALCGVPIYGVAGDQQAALFGQCCFTAGEAKNTYGTGCFALMNTGSKKTASKNRLLTTIAWGLKSGEVEYALEGSVFNAGSAIQWLQEGLGIINGPQDCDTLAATVKGCGGVVFVPAFTGLGAPHWDMYARGTLLGITRGTAKAHIVRAALESIVYQSCDLIRAMQKDSGISLSELKVDGGVTGSDFLMQFQADMLDVPVKRAKNTEATAFGAAALAGLACGFWPNQAELKAIYQYGRVFEPKMSNEQRNANYQLWFKAVERAKNWVSE